MLDHQVLCLPAQDDDEFGGDGGGFVFDSPCKSSETSPLNLDSILSPGKQRSDQQVADEFNAENFPMGLNCRQDLIDEEDDEQRDQQVEAIDLLIESNDDSLSHANAEQNAEALNNTNANQSSAKNNSLLASDLSYNGAVSASGTPRQSKLLISFCWTILNAISGGDITGG